MCTAVLNWGCQIAKKCCFEGLQYVYLELVCTKRWQKSVITGSI